MIKQLTPREHVHRECRRRKRKWGADNALQLKLMRLELKILKESPVRWVKHMTHALHGKRHLGDGTYTRGRRSKLSDVM